MASASWRMNSPAHCKRRAIRWLSLGLVASWIGLASQGAFPAIVRTDSGLVEGKSDSSVTVFRGLPFSRPPVGRLRWRVPEPPAAWPGVREASTFSPRCAQTGAYPPESPEEPTSEDCLYLNIWVPSGSLSTPLPVMVWFYGGGLENGSASIPLYWGRPTR
jgi:para-nitrobenzyl esterase